MYTQVPSEVSTVNGQTDRRYSSYFFHAITCGTDFSESIVNFVFGSQFCLDPWFGPHRVLRDADTVFQDGAPFIPMTHKCLYRRSCSGFCISPK